MLQVLFINNAFISYFKNVCFNIWIPIPNPHGLLVFMNLPNNTCRNKSTDQKKE